MLLQGRRIAFRRFICTSKSCSSHYDPDHRPEFHSLQHIDEKFNSIPKENRNKTTFLAAIDMFKKRAKNERGHVEFITSAVKHMKDYGLHKDLETYKALMDVFPRGPFRTTTAVQRMFFHFPHQQECAIKLMDEMEWNHVYPDKELHDMVSDVFGPYTLAGRKAKRQLYWLPKLRYTNKYLDVRKVENKDLGFLEFAKIALEMMCRDPGTTISVSKMANGTLIASGQAPLQQRLIEQLPKDRSCFYVDGPYTLYVQRIQTQYVVLSTDPTGTVESLSDKFLDHNERADIDNATLYKGVLDEHYDEPDDPTIHEQKDMTILALGMMETYDQNTASAWINHLIESNPTLKESTVILRIKEKN